MRQRFSENFIKVLGFGFALILVAACSSSGAIKMSQPLEKRIDNTNVASLSVSMSEAVKTGDDSAREVTQRLRGSLFGRLVSEGIFKQVVHDRESAQFHIDVRLMDAREVSAGARIFLGVLAGANSLAVTVTVIDNDANKPVTNFVVTGKSASHPLSPEDDMDDAIEEVVDEIILALQ